MSRSAQICACQDHGWVVLTRGYIGLVSIEDIALLNRGMPWCTFINQAGNLYAVTKTNSKKTSYLHRKIMKPSKSIEIDHINGNGLDNRRQNLRLASKSQNASNRKKIRSASGIKGVQLDSRIYLKKRWISFIRLNGKSKHLGYFNTKEEAAAAYEKAAIEKFGEFASPVTNKHHTGRARHP